VSLFGSKKPVRVQIFGKTDLGRSRDHNEDCFLVADLTRKQASLQPQVRQHELGDHGTLLVVADGMGGAAAGELASQMATDAIYQHLARTWSEEADVSQQRFAYRLKEAVEVANGTIHAHAKAHPELRGMGTTMTAVGALADQLYLTQVGDSRAYLVRHGAAHQLTKDQSLMQRLVEAGELTEEEAAVSERKNIILQALGPDPKVKVDLTHQEIRRGDILVLCSDGLSGQVKKEEIAQAVLETKDLSAACDRLIGLANQRGGPDNITVVAARFDGDGLRPSGGSGGQAEEVGHQVYPLIDTETSTEPVPIYKGSRAPVPAKEARGRLLTTLLAALAAVALLLWYLSRSP
jgi:serine/threonine protein phosphatase PrpC